MNAINNDDMLQRVDFGAIRVMYALTIARDALAGEKDADLYGCALDQIEKTLNTSLSDLKAAGANI